MKSNKALYFDAQIIREIVNAIDQLNCGQWRGSFCEKFSHRSI